MSQSKKLEKLVPKGMRIMPDDERLTMLGATLCIQQNTETLGDLHYSAAYSKQLAEMQTLHRRRSLAPERSAHFYVGLTEVPDLSACKMQRCLRKERKT